MVEVQLSNGVSWGTKYKVTSEDASAGKVEFKFISGVNDNAPAYDMAFTVMILRSGNVSTSDAKITINGSSISVENGTTYSLTANDVIYVIGSRAM